MIAGLCAGAGLADLHTHGHLHTDTCSITCLLTHVVALVNTLCGACMWVDAVRASESDAFAFPCPSVPVILTFFLTFL